MRVIIVEDEYLAREELRALLRAAFPATEVVAELATVAECVDRLPALRADLLFMDVQLTDGLSFEVFEQVAVAMPVVFTTAYDQYAVAAFRVRAVDYLLKPIDPAALTAAVQHALAAPPAAAPLVVELLEELRQRRPGAAAYRERFLVERRGAYHVLPVADVAYLYAEDKLTVLVGFDGASHLLDEPLVRLAAELHPGRFFQVSRRLLVNIRAVVKAEKYANHRLRLELGPAPAEPVIIPRHNVKNFLAWLAW